MMRQLVFLLCFLCGIPSTQAEGNLKFRIYLKDKPTGEYRLDNPQAFLSLKSLARRERQHIAVNITDIPVYRPYITQIEQASGGRCVTTSRWQNTAVVSVADSSALTQITALPFVDSVKLVWVKPEVVPVKPKPSGKIKKEKQQKDRKNRYGAGLQQIALHNGEKLHKAGFKGKGMTIAVIDAGFKYADVNYTIDPSRIAGTHDFVEPQSDFFLSHEHGTMVLATIAACNKGVLTGTAPEATFWLLRSEDADTEFPVEEDYWTAAAEFADSVGVDVITSSLGYSLYDIRSLGKPQSTLGRDKSFITRTAETGARKGMLILCSAGNEYTSEWHAITIPGDAETILTVGAIDSQGQPSTFSGAGYTDERGVKPDIVALGTAAATTDPSGNVTRANGTSFATPIMAGLATCLWQALPQLSAQEIIQLIRDNSSLRLAPDSLQGYGIPDIYNAYLTAKQQLETQK